MASCSDCKTGDVMSVGDGYGFSVIGDRNRPLSASSCNSFFVINRNSASLGP